MRKYLLAVVAASAITSAPATARDGRFYVGIEGGISWPGSADGNAVVDFSTVQFPATPVSPLLPIGTREVNNGFGYDFDMGYDLDLIGGYDFGMFRLEAELGYKHANREDLDIGDDLFNDSDFDLGQVNFIDGDLDGTDGEISIWSAMANGLVDFGNEDGISFYAGGGFGWAKARALNDSDGAFAWQLIAGARYAISPTIDLGVKYRYFSTGDLELRGGEAFSRTGPARAILVGPPPGAVVAQQTTVRVSPTIDDKFTSHSLLASLIFNFGESVPPPPPYVPPPPPPAAPATQTCPDGSVILATDVCPAPPPYVPPTPPEPAPERG